MMYALVATMVMASAAGAQNPDAQSGVAATQEPTGAQLVSKMLARYYEAKTVQGTIDMTQTAQGVKVGFRTQLAMQSPSLILIAQEKFGSEPRKWLTVADGKRFAYDRPPGVFGKDRFLEPQNPASGPINVRDIYAIVADGLGDRSPVLDAVIGRPDHLRNLRATWGPRFTLAGKTDWKGKPAYVVTGTFRIDWKEAPSQHMEMVIDADGNFLKYFTRASLTVPNQRQPIVIETTYTVDLKVDEPIDTAIFSVR